MKPLNQEWLRHKYKGFRGGYQPLTLDYLILKGLIGFYGKCVVTTVFVWDNKAKETINFFTRCTLTDENKGELAKTIRKFNVLKLNSKFCIGYEISEMSLEIFNRKYYDLVNKNIWSNKEHNTLTLANLEKQEIKYVKQDVKRIPLSELLEHSISDENYNQHPGSYVQEFVNIDQEYISDFLGNTPFEQLKLISECLSDLSIDFGNMTERVGGFIIQLPIDIIRFKRLDGCNVEFKWDERTLHKSPNQLIFSKEVIKEVPELSVRTKKHGNRIMFPSNKDKYSCSIFNKKRGLKIGVANNCRYQNISAGYPSNISVFNKSIERTIKISGKTDVVDVSLIPPKTPSPPPASLNLLENRRKIKFDAKILRNSKSFAQLGLEDNVSQKHKKALQTINQLIEENGHSGVYLWDPYLSSKDIIKTLLYCRYYCVPMRALTSKKIYTNLEEIEDKSGAPARKIWFKSTKQVLLDSSNMKGLNLEFRCAYGMQGCNFHDRFLIFPHSTKTHTSRVWSLGISLNQIGKEHHILQEIQNAQMVLDAFDDLWNKLNDKRYTVFSTKK